MFRSQCVSVLVVGGGSRFESGSLSRCSRVDRYGLRPNIGDLFGTLATRLQRRDCWPETRCFGPKEGLTARKDEHMAGVGCQNSAMASDQRFQAAGSYSLMSPPRIG